MRYLPCLDGPFDGDAFDTSLGPIVKCEVLAGAQEEIGGVSIVPCRFAAPDLFPMGPVHVYARCDRGHYHHEAIQ